MTNELELLKELTNRPEWMLRQELMWGMPFELICIIGLGVLVLSLVAFFKIADEF